MVRRRHRSHDRLVSSLAIFDDKAAAQSALRFRGINSDSSDSCVCDLLEGGDCATSLDRIGIDWYRDRAGCVVLARTNRFRTIAGHTHEDA